MNRNIWKEEQLIYMNKGVGGELQQSDIVATSPPPTHSSKTLPLKTDIKSVTIQIPIIFSMAKPLIYRKVKAMNIFQIPH